MTVHCVSWSCSVADCVSDCTVVVADVGEWELQGHFLSLVSYTAFDFLNSLNTLWLLQNLLFCLFFVLGITFSSVLHHCSLQLSADSLDSQKMLDLKCFVR